MEDIIWKDVPGYSGYYEVNNHGLIRGVERLITFKCKSRVCKSKVLKQRENRNGYLKVTLSRYGIKKTYETHRLIALVFLPIPLGKSCVNHINGNKLDNRIENLEWVSHSENNLHAIKLGLRQCRRIVDIQSGRLYNSISEAAKETEISQSKLKRIFCMGQKNDTCLRLAV